MITGWIDTHTLIIYNAKQWVSWVYIAFDAYAWLTVSEPFGVLQPKKIKLVYRKLCENYCPS